MSKKNLVIVLVLLVANIGVGFGLYRLFKINDSLKNSQQSKTIRNNSVNTDDTNNTQPTQQTDTQDDQVNIASGISNDELEQHNSSSDCWLAIEGKVYNVSDFINSHPGGSIITMGCGKDATTLFRFIPGGGSHSDRAEQMLPDFYVGDLIN